MTTHYQATVTCRNCRSKSDHLILGSTNAFGSPDLDLRPPEMQRSTMATWLQLCPTCGHCAPDLEKSKANARLLQSSEYRATLEDQRFPELARRFLVYALSQAPNDLERAASARLRAAWVCDDQRLEALADECRLASVSLFERLKPYSDDDEGNVVGAIAVDLRRRAGQFEKALAETGELLARPSVEGVIRQVLEFQSNLIRMKDRQAHTIDECVS